jgi:hypothetical protein
LSDMPHDSNATSNASGNASGPENQTRAYKAAKLAVIILSALIILALIAIVAGGVSKIRGKSAPEGDPSSVQLAPGAHIVEMQSQPGRLILRIRNGGAEEIRIIDTQNGRLVGQVRATFDPAR